MIQFREEVRSPTGRTHYPGSWERTEGGPGWGRHWEDRAGAMAERQLPLETLLSSDREAPAFPFVQFCRILLSLLLGTQQEGNKQCKLERKTVGSGRRAESSRKGKAGEAGALSPLLVNLCWPLLIPHPSPAPLNLNSTRKHGT